MDTGLRRPVIQAGQPGQETYYTHVLPTRLGSPRGAWLEDSGHSGGRGMMGLWPILELATAVGAVLPLLPRRSPATVADHTAQRAHCHEPRRA